MDYELQQNSVCLTWQTKRAITEIARALGENPDVLADKWLFQLIILEHGDVLRHIEAQSERTETFRKELKQKLNSKPL